MQITAGFGKLLWLLARSVGARAVLEVGTLGGYSAMWMARALPSDGRLVTLEGNRRHAEVARANLARAGLADIVEVREGPELRKLIATAPPDAILVSADRWRELALREAATWRVLASNRLGGRTILLVGRPAP